MFLKNKNDKDYSETCKATYNLLFDNFGYTIRISDILKLIQLAYGLEEFEILRYEDCNNGDLYSYLIDKQIDWQNGNDVDFEEVYNKILEIGDFTQSEKRLFESGNIFDRLWAIYLVICNPGLKL